MFLHHKLLITIILILLWLLPSPFFLNGNWILHLWWVSILSLPLVKLDWPRLRRLQVQILEIVIRTAGLLILSLLAWDISVLRIQAACMKGMCVWVLGASESILCVYEVVKKGRLRINSWIILVILGSVKNWHILSWFNTTHVILILTSFIHLLLLLLSFLLLPNLRSA